jgi:outer membrane protein assembly factor BamA
LIGNDFINDHELRKRVLLQEGDFFARKKLMQSLTSVSKLKTIYPVTLNDVVIQLNDREKTIDITICVKEKPPASVTETL